jgi:hypothetical protein
MPADGQAFLIHYPTATTGLRGVCRRHSDDSAPSVHCFGCEDAQEARPARISDALGEAVILEHVGRLQIFVIEHIVLSHELERNLLVEVLSLAAHRLMRLGQQRHRLTSACAALLAL